MLVGALQHKALGAAARAFMLSRIVKMATAQRQSKLRARWTMKRRAERSCAARAEESDDALPGPELSYDETVDEMLVEGVDNSAAPAAEKDFVCRSSPSVEASVRGIARDINQLREGSYRSDRNYSDDLVFSDGVRSLRGTAALRRYTPIALCLREARSVVARMQMLEEDKAAIWWRLLGSNALGNVDIAIRTTATMNLITGRATEVVEESSTSQSSLPAALLFASQKSAHAAQQALVDARQSVERTISRGGSSKGGNSDGSQQGLDPSSGAIDPTRFTSGGSGNRFDEYTQIAMLLLVAYILFRVLLVLGDQQ